jgi:hypothetical protein
MSESDQLLKDFLEEFFDFTTLKKVGFFPKDCKKSDIHEQAKRICNRFGYKSVFEYGATKIRCHISCAQGDRPHHVNQQGELIEEPFITEIGGIYD